MYVRDVQKSDRKHVCIQCYVYTWEIFLLLRWRFSGSVYLLALAVIRRGPVWTCLLILHYIYIFNFHWHLADR